MDVPPLPALHRTAAGLLAGALLASGCGGGSPPAEMTDRSAEARITRGPYLALGTSTSIVVRWRTDLPATSEVRYGPDPRALDFAAGGEELRTEHEVRLDGLEPATRYHYSVGARSLPLAGGDGDHFFVTSPEPGTPASVRVLVLGDSGTADEVARAVRDAYEAFTGDVPTGLWLMLGDNAYRDGTDSEYQRAVFETYPELLRTVALWPTLGNHDGRSADSEHEAGPYYDVFTLPRRGEAGGVASGTEAYYSFDHGNVHSICLDSYGSDRLPDGPMLTWLREDLAATRQSWIVAFWHHAPYTKGTHDSDSEGQLVEMRENAVPILEAGGVDLVLCGHSHDYERSFLIDGHYGPADTFSASMLEDGGDGRPGGSGPYVKPAGGPVPHAGTVYVVAGSSGQAGSGPLDHPAMAVSLAVAGCLVLDFAGDRLDAAFVDREGRVRDRFRILKR